MKPMSIDAELHELLSMSGGSIDDSSVPPIQTKPSPSASPLTGRGTAQRSPLNPTVVTETSMNVCLVVILATYQLLVSYYVHPYEEALFVRFVLFITQPFADRLHDVLFLIALWLICLAAAAIHAFFVGAVVSCVRSELERLSPPFGYAPALGPGHCYGLHDNVPGHMPGNHGEAPAGAGAPGCARHREVRGCGGFEDWRGEVGSDGRACRASWALWVSSSRFCIGECRDFASELCLLPCRAASELYKSVLW
ncbi:hypothetical protein NUW54_g3253 [Trametes sanguinea]|uniref:Uncharacterized protein n=1 Tax=Trametes sanguinea TaxID=158606 RepID=A0ACC1Q431_9APHY|nr:hypothetical protein NUW54_g3253 [Trametes sanguinea]